MRAMLIDPHEKRITEIEIEQGIDAMYKAIDAPRFDRAPLCKGIDMWVDDEGLLRSGQAFFSIAGINELMAGKALLLGNNNQGESIGLPDYVEIKDLNRMVQWHGGAESAEMCIKLGLVTWPGKHKSCG
jgi:hypothetical protein